MKRALFLVGPVLLTACAITARLPSPRPGISSYTLKIEAVGVSPVGLRGSYSLNGGSKVVDLSGHSTPYAATFPGQSFEGVFRADDPRRHIKVVLYDSEENTSAPAATGKGREISLMWARPGAGPREVEIR